MLSNHTPITLPVHVIHGERPGPVMFLCGVVHGDEIMGVEDRAPSSSSIRS